MPHGRDTHRDCAQQTIRINSGTEATELMDENREDLSKSLIPWMQPWRGGALSYPVLDTPPGLVAMRTTREEKDMCKEMCAS